MLQQPRYSATTVSMQLKATHATHAANRQTIQEKFQDSDKHVTIWAEMPFEMYDCSNVL